MNIAIGLMSIACNYMERLSYPKSCLKVYNITEMEMYSVTRLSNLLLEIIFMFYVPYRLESFIEL